MCIDLAPFYECPTSVGCSKEGRGSWQRMGRQCMHFTRRQGHGAVQWSGGSTPPPPPHRLHAIAGNAVWCSARSIPARVNYTTLMGNWECKKHARPRYTTDSSALGGTLAPDAAPDPPALLLLSATTPRMASRSCFSADRYSTRSDECTTRLAPRATHRRWWATQSVKE